MNIKKIVTSAICAMLIVGSCQASNKKKGLSLFLSSLWQRKNLARGEALAWETCKPNFVEGDHLSCSDVAAGLMRATKLALAPERVYRVIPLPGDERGSPEGHPRSFHL